MKIIQKNAEGLLFQTVKTHWEQDSSQRCLFLRCSQFKDNKKQWLPILIEELEQFFADGSGQIFACHDNDIFVLNRFITQKNLSDFLTHLAPKLRSAPLSFSHLPKGLTSLFEINVDWVKIKKLCQRKIDVLEKQKKNLQKQKEQELAIAYHEKLMSTKVGGSLISSLSQRRDERKNTEVLVVEDDLFSQRLVRNSINKTHSVVTAKDGCDAIKNYASSAPDILFLDIGLPDITGHDVLHKILEIDPDAYVVMLSGNADRENVLKAVEHGAKGFIVKPFTQEKLFQYIEKSPFIQEKQNKESNNERSIH